MKFEIILVFCVVFCRSLFVLLSFSFGHGIVCPSSIHKYLYILIYIKFKIMIYVTITDGDVTIFQIRLNTLKYPLA